MQRRFPLIRLAFAMLRQSTFPRGRRLNRSHTRCHFERSREIPRGRNGNNRTRIPEILARRGTLPSVAETTVSPSGRFPRSLRSLGMTYYKGCARRLIVFIRFNPNRTPVPPCHCERRRSRNVAISRKGNASHVPAPAYLPAVARRPIYHKTNNCQRQRAA